ncbi:MAG: UDP-N-acetylglucosamine 2-epimerase (non-hydrolyzing) [Chloroflexi bacterium]|jgi:UDP-N-acetylglucosamine 2-epimerase (non-hydrolysing)|nr:UDP-N-acetylglucosamine 2-epimerase (non-hydrolyzing) [Chloroflexota bacterium]MBT4073002.1 UDP-N-acetylglucosamine 2-epimerase (non-hydrolyzing) [Chloroflexota bacterium]MBT6680752.1 UDP-N-acetylglucosamine 2-epimerase (non-hydrolyzing) [Chloroflexota bacterium]
MKVMTVLGTRPEIIRLSRLIPLLDQLCDHTLVHTGQNYDPRLSELFFKDLEVREPDVYLNVRASGFGEQIGKIITGIEQQFLEKRPERLLVLGDTNSGLVALVAKRMGIQVFHMEAGNRCYDDRVPEEVNRRVIDHSSTVLLPYTHRSKENLLAEGIQRERIFVTGNPINEVLGHYEPQVKASTIMTDLGLENKDFLLVTMHRAENVDDEGRLRTLMTSLAELHKAHGKRVICSVHPRTRSKLDALESPPDMTGVEFLEPFGFFDFVRLEQEAFCVISDSGTVQEEACIFGTPNVTIRDVTERPETIESGSNILAGIEPESVLQAVNMVTTLGRSWRPPYEYTAEDVAQVVSRIVLGHRILDRVETQWRDSSG